MSDLMKGKYWFESMPLEKQFLYLENITDEQLELVDNMYFENFSSFLSESFVWNDTPEGYEFWLHVSQFNVYDI